MTLTPSPATLTALQACIVQRGPNKGRFRAKAPSAFTQSEANVAWHAAMLVINPHKVSVYALLRSTRSPELRAIAEEVRAIFNAHPTLIHLDKDRSTLERLGVW